MSFTFERAFSLGWQVFKENYGRLLGATAILFLVRIALEIVFRISLAANEEAANLGMAMVMLFLWVPFSVGISWFGLQCLRGEKPGMGSLFVGFTRYWEIIGICFLIFLLIVGPILLIALMAGFLSAIPGFSLMWPAIFLSSLTTLVLAFWLGIRLGYAPLICIDSRRDREGVMACLRTSWRATGPVYWPLLGLYLVLCVIAIGTFIACLFPLIFFGMPLLIAVGSAAYEMIVGESGAAPATTATIHDLVDRDKPA